MIVKRGIPTRNTLQTVVKVENDLIERQLIDQHHAVFGHVLKPFLHAAFFIQQRQDAAEEFVIREDGRLDIRFFYFTMRPVSGIFDGESISATTPSVVVTR